MYVLKVCVCVCVAVCAWRIFVLVPNMPIITFAKSVFFAAR